MSSNLSGTSPTSSTQWQRVPRLARLTDVLWTGGALPNREDTAAAVIDAWRGLGIGAVVDCRAEWSDEGLVASIAPEIAYINPGVIDGGQPMKDDWFDTITSFANGYMANGVGVLVHCHSGINRGPSAAFAVLLTLGWDPVEAVELIRSARPAAVVSYAENAIDWWHRVAGLTDGERVTRRQRFDEWRRVERSERLAAGARR